ncbi:hypothetical protein BJ322DRAFT_1155723 [Thelephora terrestris]|uniref:Uncharacterized protein n=1 Tax=Thelephora terrestris TaxID=56493 RepID=A0A9P6HVF5_9AGAM|nr:hypothetical protein BJ322DRAFT_1155723 [Thelephora terrestris]
MTAQELPAAKEWVWSYVELIHPDARIATRANERDQGVPLSIEAHPSISLERIGKSQRVELRSISIDTASSTSTILEASHLPSIGPKGTTAPHAQGNGVWVPQSPFKRGTAREDPNRRHRVLSMLEDGSYFPLIRALAEQYAGLMNRNIPVVEVGDTWPNYPSQGYQVSRLKFCSWEGAEIQSLSYEPSIDPTQGERVNWLTDAVKTRRCSEEIREGGEKDPQGGGFNEEGAKKRQRQRTEIKMRERRRNPHRMALQTEHAMAIVAQGVSSKWEMSGDLGATYCIPSRPSILRIMTTAGAIHHQVERQIGRVDILVGAGGGRVCAFPTGGTYENTEPYLVLE